MLRIKSHGAAAGCWAESSGAVTNKMETMRNIDELF
jgi:hypothetical protein